MKLALLALAGTAVALPAVPASAARHYTNHVSCAKYRHGRCVAWNRMTRARARHANYRVGYRFGPRYSYTSYNALPRTYVTRYHLRPNYRYVYSDNRIYVVDPTTYAVQRVIDAVTR
jgi:hypothetical protein